MPRFFSRRMRRHLLVPIVLALTSAIFVLLVDRAFFRPKPLPLPIIVPGVVTNQNDGETRVHANPCIDLHSYICTNTKRDDPTGDVRRDAEGEVDVLRIYEGIIRSNRRLTSDKIDEILVKKVYTPGRVKRIHELFDRSKARILQLIDSQPFQALTQSDKQALRTRVERVKLELPPPASVYADEPDLFTRNDVYYERTSDGRVRIRIGGALFFTVRSQFNLAFTLAHELAHSIDPCEMRADGVDILSYRVLAECFGSPQELITKECGKKGKLSEIFADWVATHVVAEILNESAAKFTAAQTRAAVYNTVRDLCRDGDDDDGENDDASELASSHPTVQYRINRIFAQHPKIRRFLSCAEATGPLLPGVPSYCFWPLTTKKNRE